MRQRLATLFVDIAGSTRLLVRPRRPRRARARLREILERECALSRDERDELTCEPKSDAVSSSD